MLRNGSNRLNIDSRHAENHEVMEQIDVRILSWDGPESKSSPADERCLAGFFSVFFFFGGGVAK